LTLLANGTDRQDTKWNMALSLDTDELFWINKIENCISRMTLSGENKTCINVTTNKPAGIALDVENRCLK